MLSYIFSIKSDTYIKNKIKVVVSKKKSILGKFKGIDNKLNKKKLAKRIDDTMELADFDKQQSKVITEKMDDLAKQTDKLKTQQAAMKELNNLKKAAISDGDKKGAGLFKNKLNNMKINVAKTTKSILLILQSHNAVKILLTQKKLVEGVLDYSNNNKWVLKIDILKALPGIVAYHIPKDVAKKAKTKLEKDIAKNAKEYITEEINGSNGNQKSIDVSAVADQVF